MSIKNRPLSILFKIIIIIIIATGIILQFSANNYDWHLFNYFTILSNILCLLYLLNSVTYMFKCNDIRVTTFNPLWRGFGLTALTLTCLIANILLGNQFDFTNLKGISLFILHIITPALFILDWLLFDTKGRFIVSYPLIWTLFPLGYLLYIYVGVKIMGSLALGSVYPYPFMDVDKIGVSNFIITMLVMIVGFLIMSYLYFILDYKLDFREEIKQPKHYRKHKKRT